MTNPPNVVGHTSGLCPVCHQPYGPEAATVTDVEAVDHVAAHGPRAVAFALLVAEGHRLLAQGAHDAVTMRAQQLATHLDEIAREQRAPVTGGDGW